MNDKRAQAAAAFARALRTGEGTAVRNAAARLADDVIFDANGHEQLGRNAVVARLSGQWPLTPALARGIWSAPQAHGDRMRIDADFSALGAAPRSYFLSFAFDDHDRLLRIEERYEMPMQPVRLNAIPAHVRSALDRALANSTPVVLSYIDDAGFPALSLRGSVQVFGDLELCAWIREPAGGLVRAVKADRPLGLLYRDNATRTTLVIRGRGRVADDDETRQRVFELTPEVEQTHDLRQRGAALLIKVERITGTSPQGPVLVEPVSSA